MKLLATGDQHLGAGADLGLRPGDRLREQEDVWAWTLQQAREHEVDAILHAGDVFHHRRPDPETLLAFERPLVRHLELGGKRPLVVNGNHDVATGDAGCALDVFHEAGLIELVRKPRVVNVGGARVACLPWAPVSRLAANFDGPRDQLNEHAASLLVDVARDLHSAAVGDPAVTGSGRSRSPSDPVPPPIILLTHFSISGTALPSGLPVDQLREPVLPQEELLAIGYDAIVAGHIHRPQRFGQRGFYAGSPMPLSFGETDGEKRGPWLLVFEEDDLGPKRYPLQLEAPSRRFLNVTAADTLDPDVEGAYMKLKVPSDVDANELRETLLAHGAYRVFVETIVERGERARDTSVDDTLDEREALTRWLDAQDVPDDLKARALARAERYLTGDAEAFAAPTQEPLGGAVA